MVKVANLADFNVTGLLPELPYSTGLLVGATYLSAPLVDGLVEAYRGLSDWESLLPGRPGYLRSLVYSKQPK